ncbi:hypothetical protein GQX74_012675 [Glossina fuscipes]|nr:hypothetical protein GQX74_012675 [Glossina fuscipes]
MLRDSTIQTEKRTRANATKRLREEGSAGATPAKKSRQTGDVIDSNKEAPKHPKYANEKWTVVQAKNRKVKTIKLVKKPDGIVIKQMGTRTCSDILKRVKNDAELQKVGEIVTRIQKTVKGEILLEFKQSAKEENIAYCLPTFGGKSARPAGEEYSSGNKDSGSICFLATQT